MRHKIKCFQDRFIPIKMGKCKVDIRFNDRNYKIGDILILQEGYPSINEFIYTGNTITAEITHSSTYGVKDGFVALSLELI